MKKIIEIEHVRKYFKTIKAVDDISFSVGEGELFAFLGLNGAGKSTTISMMCGQLAPDGGRIRIDGFDVAEKSEKIKSEIGIVFQHSKLDKLLTVRDNLRTRAALYGLDGAAYRQRLGELGEMLQLEPLLDRPLGKLSGGQRRRVDIARALLHDPKILILDEPTTGLDPQSRIMVWEVIEQLRHERALTVFLTTHYMEEAAEADNIVIIDSGKIVAEGSPVELKNAYTGDFIKLYGVDLSAAACIGRPCTQENGYIKLAVPDTAAARKLIVDYPDLFTDFEVIKGKMDDVFLAATGKVLKEG